MSALRLDSSFERIGGRARPIPIVLSDSYYRTYARDLGFDFSEAEYQSAYDGDGVLGVRRYLPGSEARVALPVPVGTFVECHLEDDSAETER